MGVKATAMERRGIMTEKGDINRAIKTRNNLVAEIILDRKQTMNDELAHLKRTCLGN